MPYGGANPAAKGRGGDTELGHLQRGEIILPPDFRQQRPDLYTEIAEFLGGDIGRRTVGGSDDAINPDTGYPEFFGHGGHTGGYQGGNPPTRSGSGTGVGGVVGGQHGHPYSSKQAIDFTPHFSKAAPPKGKGLSPGHPEFDTPANVFANIPANINPKSLNLTNITPVSKAKAEAAELGHVPNTFSQANIGNVALPEIFGKFQGLTDPVTGEVVSLPQLQAMTPAQFGKFSANPDTGVVGDPNSPAGKAFDALGFVISMAMDPTLSGLGMAILGEALTGGNETLGIPGLTGDDGLGFDTPFSGLINSLSHEISNLSSSDFSLGLGLGDSTATGPGANRGGGPGIPSAAGGAPSPAQLFERLLSSDLSPEQREAATTAALNRLSAQTGQNPFTLPGGGLDEPQFADVISSGLARQNEQLVDPVSLRRFNSVFGDENLLKNILTEETGIRREGFTSDLESAFPGDAFGEIDDNIINSIIEERVGPARQQVSNFAARNLSAPGGTGANEFLRQQETEARERLGEIGGNVQSLNQLGVNAIRDVARSDIRDFELGAGFDVAPFAEQRQSLIGERTGTFGEDVRTQLGSEPLFDVSGALSAGSQAGGLVSGQPQGGEGLLDVIAERELAGRTNRRGLQRSGSGAF
jgi:hypothetical protein